MEKTRMIKYGEDKHQETIEIFFDIANARQKKRLELIHCTYAGAHINTD